MPFFEVWVSPALMQNPETWNFHLEFNGSLTLNNGSFLLFVSTEEDQ